jgi:hypothetical protein
MKKQLLNLSFVAVALGLYVTTASSQLVEPVQRLDVTATTSEMVMDGTADETGYTAMQTTTIFNPTGNPTRDPVDFGASFQLSWDSTYLYICAVVTDDIEADYNWGVGNSWTFDNVEVFIQLDTCTVPNSYNSRTVQLRICRELDSVETAGRAARTDYDYYVANTADGWVTETSIPWTCVLAAGDTLMSVADYMADYTGVEIGFDFSGADDDDTDGDPAVGNRDCQSAWDSDDPSDDADRTEDNAWNNTTVFGRITLDHIVGIESPSLSAINLYPNPTTGIINLDVNGLVDIYNVAGTLVKSVQSLDNKINVSDLSEGIYFIRTKDGMAKFIKQ